MLGDAYIALDYPGNCFSPMQIHNSLFQTRNSLKLFWYSMVSREKKNCKTVPTVLMQVNKCTFPGNSDHSKQHSPQVIKTQRISSNKRWETTKRPVWFPVFPLSLSVNRLVWFVRRLRGPVMWKKLKLNNVTTWLPSTQFQANSHRACLWKTWIQFPFKCCKQLIPNS